MKLVEVIGVVCELKLFPKRELPVSGVVLSGQVEGEAVAWLEGIRRIEVAYEDVFATDFEIVADLVFDSDRGLMPFNPGERIFRSEFITSTQMQSLSDFPIHFRRCSHTDSRTLGGSVNFCQPCHRQRNYDNSCRLKDFFRRFHSFICGVVPPDRLTRTAGNV